MLRQKPAPVLAHLFHFIIVVNPCFICILTLVVNTALIMTFRKRIHEILEVSKDKSGASWYFDIALTLLIALNAIAIVLESVHGIYSSFPQLFHVFELVSIVLFSIEYILRIWAAVEIKRFKHPVTGRLRFFFTPFAIIDLLAIIPFYITFFAIDLRYIRILRLFRLFRLFKIGRYIIALNAIADVIKKKREQLVVSIIFILFMLLITSSVMYYVEHEAQPNAFSSIPETMWWGIATLTTVGYGDVYPITALGKFLGGIISILGIGLFALPTGILASGFSEVLEGKAKNADSDNFCSKCGQPIHTSHSPH